MANKIVHNTNPRQTPGISTSVRDKKTVIIVDVKESKIKPVHAFDHAYQRSGRTNQRLSREEAFQLYANSRGITWDSTILNETSIRDVDRQAVRRFLQTARDERRWDVSPSTPANQRILDDCRVHDKPVPDIEVDRQTFRAIFKPGKITATPKVDVELNERQKKVISYIKQHGQITRNEIESLLDIHPRMANRELKILEKKGVVLRHGAGRTFWYT